MIFIDLAVRNLRRHKVRSILATVGIVIGVVAIASLGIMGSSLSTLVGGMVSDVSDTVLITPPILRHRAAIRSILEAPSRRASPRRTWGG
ncbi:hypothetical protein [Methanoculleus chikugoensis]|uniref:hypothetical protein n=1 Tax=Methanoculleus chikugoensis TaxID=118126 RepID=UPI000AB16363|nr:hypothetical protein [Methanoculleus chikugoensis]